MKSPSPDTWMPLFIGDYLSDTMHLSAEEHGAYLLLIMYYWKNGGPIKNDKKTLKKIAKISSKKLENIMHYFDEKNDGFLHHKRVDAEIEKALKRQEKQRKRTEKATAARWSKKDSVTDTVTDTVTDMLTDTVTDTVTVSATDSYKPPPLLRSNNKTSTSNPSARANHKSNGSEVLKIKNFEEEKYYDIIPHLTEKGLKQVKDLAIANDFDVYELGREYSDSVKGGKIKKGKNPDSSFYGWCKKIINHRRNVA